MGWKPMDNRQVIPPPPPGFIMVGAENVPPPAPPPGFQMAAPAPAPPEGFDLIAEKPDAATLERMRLVESGGQRGGPGDFIQKGFTNKLIGLAETPVALASGIAAIPVGFGAAAVKYLWDIWKSGGRGGSFVEAKRWKDKTTEATSYMPKTEEGAALTSAVAKPFSLAMQGMERVISETPESVLPPGLKDMPEDERNALMSMAGEAAILAVLPKATTEAKGAIGRAREARAARPKGEAAPAVGARIVEEQAMRPEAPAQAPEQAPPAVAEAPQMPAIPPTERAQAMPEPKTQPTRYPPTGERTPASRGQFSQGLQPEEYTGLQRFNFEKKMGGTTERKPYQSPVSKAPRGTPKERQRRIYANDYRERLNRGETSWAELTADEQALISEHSSPAEIETFKSKPLAPEELIKRKAESLLEKTGLPEDKITEFKANAFMDGEAVKKMAADVISGKVDEAKAVQELIKDIEATTKPAAPEVPVEILPDFTKEQFEAAELAKAKAKRLRYQDLPKNLEPSPEWKPEYDALILPALEKAKIPAEQRADATLLLKHSFSPKKSKVSDPAGAMEHYLNSRTFRSRLRAVPPEAQMPQAETEAGRIDIEPTEEMTRGEARPKGKNIIPDAQETAKEARRKEDLGDYVNRLADEYGTTIKNPKEKAAFDLWRKLPDSVSSKEIERTMREKDKSLSDDTIRKYIAKWQGDFGKKKKDVVEFLKQRDEAEDIIERDFIMPEGAVKSGGTLPPRPGAPTATQPKYAGSINLERIDEGVELKDIILKESERWGDFEKNRRTGMTFEEIGELADALGRTPEDMARVIKAKTKELPEYMVHFRDILAKAASEVQKLAIENRDNPSVEAEARFAMAFKRFEYILGTSEAGASEVGRGLASFRILSKAKEFQAVKNYKEILKRLGSQAKNADIMRMLSTLDPTDPMAVAKFLRGALKASTKDRLFELWVNGLLSNPKTWIRNFVSNAITAPIMPLTRTIAGLADLRRGKGRTISLMETPAMMQSVIPGIKDGVRRALFAWNNELTMASVSKIETAHYGSIRGKLGRAIRVPGRMLMVGDEFFKGAIRMADIYALATRQAFKEGKKGEARLDRIAELIKNPTADMEAHATGEALYYTFQKELGKWGQSAMRAREKHPVFKFIVPFLRTPINIAKFGVEHTPLKFMDILYKAKSGGLKGEALSTELSKAGLGTLTAIAVTLSVIDGDITGSAPADPEERAAFFRQGKREYSIKIGENYYPYGYLEPVGTSIGVVADFALLMDKASEMDKAKIAEKILTSFYKNMSSKTFNSGAINFLDALRDPGKFLPKFVKGLAGSVVPSGLAGVAGAIDPDMREARTILDRIVSRIPGVSKSLPPRRSVFGEVQQKPGTPLTRLISPVDPSPVKESALESELSRLNIFPGMPDKKIRGVTLTTEQYDIYVRESGALMKAWVMELINDKAYKELPDVAKDKIIRGRINAARAFARNQLFADIIRGKETD